MKQHLNTLFISTQGAYLARERRSLTVRIEREVRLRLPIHQVGGVVCLGRVSVSPAALALCAESGVAVSFMTEHGRFLARAHGFTPGNVLLRRQQYRDADDPVRSAEIASRMVAAKIANSRSSMLRAQRDQPPLAGDPTFRTALYRLQQSLDDVNRCRDLDLLRGLEGEAANTYFAQFTKLMPKADPAFAFNLRSRRPPRDPINAMLSFVYAMLTHDARAACEAAGLDPAVGFLHRDRPGRPSLALDLMEELRPVLADRLVVTLVNRQQVRPSGFAPAESGAVRMTDDTRKAVISAYQRRKQATFLHPFLDERVTFGLIVHLQARLLARYLRGDLDSYPPFLWR